MDIEGENDQTSNVSDIPEPTTQESKQIHAINKESVHRICSGQVVLSLAVAVKELVENSIDAGATLIEVKLKEQGLEYVEVSDNGSGVEEYNLQAMTAKYHTSKIREFSDLTEVTTFGFRGEALSSLCALSDMTIVTKHKSAKVGIKIELDHEGKIKSKSLCPREVGTTVNISNLFASLPVRKKEFQKNIKKEFARMCQILQAYCLVSKKIKIICSNIAEKGRKTIFLSTQGSESVLNNIIAIFGSKQTSSLVKIKPPLLDGETFKKESFTQLDDISNSSLQINSDDIDKLNNINYDIDGWISSCSHGSGRSSKDRQYFFINSRPCDNKNFVKLVNEVYHRYNINQFPFIFLNLTLKRSDVDVNVTPDKRQLLINNEKILLLAIKKSLINTFGNIPSTFKTQNSTLLDFQIGTPANNNSDDELLTTQIPNSQSFMEKLSQWKHSGSTTDIPKPLTTKRKQYDEIQQRTAKMKKIQEYLSRQTIFPNCEQSYATYNSDEESVKETNDSFDISININTLKEESEEYEHILEKTDEIHSVKLNEEEDSILIDEETIYHVQCKNIPNQASETCLRFEIDSDKINENNQITEQNYEHLNIKNTSFQDKLNEENDNVLKKDYATAPVKINETQESVKSSQDSMISVKNNVVEYDFDESDEDNAKTKIDFNVIKTSIEEIKKLALAEDNYIHFSTSKPQLSRLKFKSEINPNKNKSAEEELEKEIKKEMFAKMEIIGQFNLGFIIVKLDDDLFIIDQHATDEKYNYENLQKTVVLQSQTLTVPEKLELTALDEIILIDNIKIFETNGFKIHIDQEAPPTKKLKLLAKPFSKNWQFGKEDISDLLFMLQDASPDTMVRPSKVRSMFASRACRKSIMIGQTLNKSTMRRLVDHMGEIEQPWNCPHGRPTIRHLINIAMIESEGNGEGETNILA